MKTNQQTTRRNFLKAAGLGMTGVMMGSVGCRGMIGKQKKRQPNILLIMSDDMGFSDIGCYGSEIHTPTLNTLAANGLRFTQFYNTARCCPTRASLMTGLYSHQAGMGHMTSDSGQVGYRGDLNQNCVTIAEVMQLAGYRTYMTGKWHVTRFDGPEDSNHNWPCQRGFDRFYGTIKGGGNFYDPTSLCRDNTFITPENDSEYEPEIYYYTNAISDNATRYVKDHFEQTPNRPFFMYVAYTSAHWPMHALPEDIAKYHGVYDEGYEAIRKARFDRLKRMGLIDPDWELSEQAGDWDKVEHKEWEARCMEVYAAMIDCMDRGIGRIVEQLRRSGQLDNTLIFFLQDNGGCAEDMGRSDHKNWREFKAHKMAPDELQPSVWPPMTTRDGRAVLGGPSVMPGPADTYIGYGENWANVSNTPFRLYKHWEHEGGVSTPLIIHWPAGVDRKGELVKEPGHLIDIMATCVDVSGADYPVEYHGNNIKPMEGLSLRPAFASQPLNRTAIYFEHEGNRAIRKGKWKLVAKGADGPWELYDMEKDRTEMHDLKSQYPQVATDLEAMWKVWAERADVLPLTPYWSSNQTLSKKKNFTFRSGDDIPREQAPNIAGKSFTFTVNFDQFGGDGVIIAQGGSAEGYALFIQGGVLCFVTRHGGKETLLKDTSVGTDSLESMICTLDRKGAVQVTGGNRTLLSGNVPGPLEKMPVDGLQIGRDLKGTVGPYQAPFAYEGNIKTVVFKILD